MVRRVRLRVLDLTGYCQDHQHFDWLESLERPTCGWIPNASNYLRLAVAMEVIQRNLRVKREVECSCCSFLDAHYNFY